VGAVVVLGIAAIGYERYIPVHHVQRARLSHLVAASPPAGFKAKPTTANEVAPSSSSLAALKAAGQRAPNSAGAYSVQWPGTTSTNDVASLLVSMLPTKADAVAVQAQATKAYLAGSSFKSNNYRLLGPLAVPSVAGAQAATFGPTSAKGAQRLAVVVFQEGRYAVVAFVQQTSLTRVDASAVALAQLEAAHLQKIGSGFSLTVTTRPLVASLILVGVAVAVALLVLLVPVGVRRNRLRRRQARDAAVRRALQGRGRKIAKHQAARRR